MQTLKSPPECWRVPFEDEIPGLIEAAKRAGGSLDVLDWRRGHHGNFPKDPSPLSADRLAEFTFAIRDVPAELHNPENVPASYIPAGWRFLTKAEASVIGEAGKPVSRLWMVGYFSENECVRNRYDPTDTYIVPATPTPSKPALAMGPFRPAGVWLRQKTASVPFRRTRTDV